jgi:hypothetical protein
MAFTLEDEERVDRDFQERLYAAAQGERDAQEALDALDPDAPAIAEPVASAVDSSPADAPEPISFVLVAIGSLALVTWKLLRQESTRVFMPDGLSDRYTGERLAFPPVLRLISAELPDEFP